MRYYYKKLHTYFVLSESVLQTFSDSRQHKSNQPEAGGQLFGKFVGDEVMVEIATVTSPSGRRWRHFFLPDRAHEQRDIDRQFAEGRHFLGDWHTHPENRPSPSGKDLATMLDCFAKSRHELIVFLQVIVGLNDGEAGLWVGVHDDKNVKSLKFSGN